MGCALVPRIFRRHKVAKLVGGRFTNTVEGVVFLRRQITWRSYLLVQVTRILLIAGCLVLHDEGLNPLIKKDLSWYYKRQPGGVNPRFETKVGAVNIKFHRRYKHRGSSAVNTKV
jgi:hypothetical protein